MNVFLIESVLTSIHRHFVSFGRLLFLIKLMSLSLSEFPTLNDQGRTFTLISWDNVFI